MATDPLTAFGPRWSARAAGIVSRLETSGGNLVPSRRNLAMITEIIGEMRTAFNDSEFLRSVAEYLKGFDGITADVLKRLASFGTIDPGMARAIADGYKNVARDRIASASAYDGTLFQPIAEQLLLGVTTGSPLEDIITGIASKGQELSALIKDTAAGTQTVLGRTITNFVATEVGADFFLFQGRPIDTTRPWCRAREGKYWHRREIEQWGREAASGDGWEGMVEGTNEATIFVHLGGWYGKRGACRHTLVPVHMSDVPKSDLERMRSKGYID